MAGESFESSVKHCARCGEDHEEVQFEPFTRFVPDPDGDYTQWALCPTTGEPILLRFVDNLGDADDDEMV
jgi:hypothetical protein